MTDIRIDTDMAASFAELSASAARNRLFSQKAKAEKKAQTAVLLSAVAESEEIMARRALMALRGKISDLDDYLEKISGAKARAGERFEQRSRRARDEHEDGLAEAYERFGAVSRNSGEQLGADADATFYVCQVCGYIAADEVPERCPVCNAVSKKFRAHSL
jgi:rubrerythrin